MVGKSHSSADVFVISIQYQQPQGFDNASKVEVTFESASAGAHSKSKHASTTDTAKHAGDIVSWDDRVPVDLKGNMLKVVAKASKALLPDKVLGEGMVDVSQSSGGQQRVELVNPKTGGPGGVVTFTLQGGNFGSGVGGTSAGQQGQQGMVPQGQQGYGQQGMGQQGMGQQGQQGYGQQGMGQQGMVPQGQQGMGQQGMGGQGMGQQGMGGQGMGGGGEHTEKRSHNVHDHDENESYERSDRGL